VSGSDAILTVQRTLVPGDVLRPGIDRAYRALATAAGEPHTRRDDLLPAFDGQSRTPPGRRPLLAFAHATDLQLADVQSPARFEFCNRDVDDPRFDRLVPMHRPQEALIARATEAMVGTLNAIHEAPVTGVPVELVVTTGDAVDNAQWNEMRMFLGLFEGGAVRPGSGGARYEGVQSLAWDDDSYWKPDGDTANGPDAYRRRYGFPHAPGLLQQALADFTASGLRLPWLACFGNHEVLTAGVGLLTEAIRDQLVGAGKAAGPLTDLGPGAILDAFIREPAAFLHGHRHPVTPDPGRRAVTRSEFVAGHFGALSSPHGHGFTETNRREGTAYYVHDVGAVRLICLDTTCRAGAADGCLDSDQFGWLREQLEASQSRYLGPDGTTVTTGQQDRLVVLFSHHGIDTLTNTRTPHHGPDGVRLVGAPQLLELLHRFDNVVAWVNGHQHRNRVVPRADLTKRSNGFWEVTTSSLMDWPCQTRVIELADNGDGTLSVLGTMVDHDGVVQPDPGAERTRGWLAGMHRELAGNEPWRGFGSGREGVPADRNVDLRLPAPFDLTPLSRASAR
jgi:metallophosphoesterase (TIGR03767 family)